MGHLDNRTQDDLRERNEVSLKAEGRKTGRRRTIQKFFRRPVSVERFTRGRNAKAEMRRKWSQDAKLSEEEHRADALAPSAEEGRGKLRKASGSRKQAKSRGCPNVETRHTEGMSAYDEPIVIRGGPDELKHLSSRRKRK